MTSTPMTFRDTYSWIAPRKGRLDLSRAGAVRQRFGPQFLLRLGPNETLAPGGASSGG